ncbi:predicted protein [Plenodomus lingam JN3]|uniref:Predicted protein n=1 Tax=Leptosphaeria maculans (strain JN3 / isolate v23.1.3 / race Av1-4-5-6-7-8) TaxID=985895 RepID=E5AB76_LEPMJ|nr:predicted protein [Plenodomus lingam JN3]CBY00917.1 predicted protein [Plenodomus lingam JN3]
MMRFDDSQKIMRCDGTRKLPSRLASPVTTPRTASPPPLPRLLVIIPNLTPIHYIMTRIGKSFAE